MYHNDRGVIVMKRRQRMLFLVAPLLLLSACNSEMEGSTNNEKKYISSIQKKETYEIQQPAKCRFFYA